MSPNLLEQATLLMLGIALALGLWRLLKGPHTGDRIIAADTLGVITTGGLALLAALLGQALYLDVALIYGTLAFIGVVALARAIERDAK